MGLPPGEWDGPAPGTLIDNAYRVQGPLGQGGMGVVVLAIDERLEREVAIKLIRPAYVQSQNARRRFLTEARAMARIRHENVVEIYAFGEFDGAPYFVMEYVPGTTVANWLDHQLDNGSIPGVDEAIVVLEQICRGVSAIHASGAVHGDLKPSNVLLGPASRVAIADLGLARVLSGSQKMSPLAGTPAYMAPEQVVGNPAPPELAHVADIYALGVIAFELLTGKAPFRVESARDLIMLRGKPAPRPTLLRSELPPGFDDALLDALIEDPRRRTPSADAFRRALIEARESATESHTDVRVLVADDDEDFLSLAYETLAFALPGARIECVRDGGAALSAIDRETATLAVIDLDMPGMNGVELTAALRATEHAESMPIIVVTASGGAPDWHLLQSLGADGFLVKPIDPFALVALVRKTLGTPHTGF